MRVYLAFILIISGIFPVEAEKTTAPKESFSMWFGGRIFNQPPVGMANQLDFFDYLISEDWEQTNYRASYGYLGLGYSNLINQSFEADIRLTMNSAFRINTGYLRGIYYLVKQIGVTMTYYAYPQLLNEFRAYYDIQELKSYSYIDDPDRMQWSIYDHTVSAGILFPFNQNYLSFKVGVNAGIMFTGNFKCAVNQKEVHSNLRQRIEYEFLPSPAFFINPELELDIDFIRFKEKSVGMKIKSNWLTASKSIDYRKTVYQWTIENPVSEIINNVKHEFSRFEFDCGFYYQW